MVDHAHENAAKAFAGVLKTLAGLCEPRILVRPEIGEAGFPELHADAERVKAVLDRCEGAPRVLPFQALEDLRATLDNVLLRAATDVHNYRPGEGHNREATSNNFRAAAGKLVTKLLPVAAAVTAASATERLSVESAAIRTELGDDLATLRKTIEQAEGKLRAVDETLNTVDATLEGFRTELSEVAVHKQGQHFLQAASQHQVAARWWLGVSALFGTALAGTSVWAATIAERQMLLPEAIQVVAAKAILFSVLFTGLIVAMRSYRANRHNAVVNRHRVNALETYRSLVEAGAGDRDVKHALLLQASACVFGPQPSGYSSREGDPVAAATAIDVAKAFMGPRNSGP